MQLDMRAEILYSRAMRQVEKLDKHFCVGNADAIPNESAIANMNPRHHFPRMGLLDFVS
jgi:hypothetical protein